MVVLLNTIDHELLLLLLLLMMIKLLLLKLLIELPPKLLSVSGLVILKPVEHILAFNLSIEREMGCDLLDLGSVGSSGPSSVHLFKDHQLLGCWAPS